MSTYTQIKAGLAATLDASANLSVVYADPTDTPITPCAIIVPAPAAVEYKQAMQNGLAILEFRVTIMVQRFDQAANIAKLDPFVYGPDSVRALVDADRTLDSTVSDAVVTRCVNIGNVGYGDDIYLGAEFEIEVYAE